MISFKKKSVLYSLIISYLFILIVPLFSMGLIYTNLGDILQKQISEYYYGYLRENVRMSDLTVSYLSNTMSNNLKNSYIQEFASSDGSNFEKLRYDIINERAQYLNYANNNLLDDMFVSFKNLQYISGINSCRSERDYYETNYKDVIGNYDQWQKLTQEKHIMEFVTIENAGRYNVFYVSSLFVPGTRQVIANIVFKVKSDALLCNVQKEDEISFIVNEQNNVILASDDIDIKNIMKIADSDSDTKKSLKINDIEYLVIKAKSNAGDWEHVYCINKETYMNKITQSKNLIIAIIATCVVLCLILVRYLSGKQYEPVKRIASEIENMFGIKNNEADEYKYIEIVINRVMKENGNQTNNTHVERQALLELTLSKLLLGERCNEKAYDLFQTALVYDNYLAVMLGFENLDYIFFEEASETKFENETLAKFIVCNVMKDSLNEDFRIKSCDANGIRVILIAMKNFEDSEKIYGMICNVQDIVAQNFNVKFIASVSDVHIGIEGLPKCYFEAKEALDCSKLSTKSILKYHEVVNDANGTNYYYPMKIENQLISLLKASDYEQSKQLLRSIINENAARFQMLPLNTKCLVYDIMATILKVLNETGINYDKVFNENGVMLEQITTLDALKNYIFDVVKKICDETGAVSARNGIRISKQVFDFVDNHYNDPNISVAYISEKVGVSVNHLTKIVKQQTGMTILEYITKVRMEKAKQLLKETNIKLEGIAEMVGYNNVRTFTRSFVKYEGFSPGKYRNI